VNAVCGVDEGARYSNCSRGALRSLVCSQSSRVGVFFGLLFVRPRSETRLSQVSDRESRRNRLTPISESRLRPTQCV